MWHVHVHSELTPLTLSLSVNNPSCWMQLYAQNPYNALFFISFIICTFFYVQKIMLAIILEQYNTQTREVSEARREELGRFEAVRN